MTCFIRLIDSNDKPTDLLEAVVSFRRDENSQFIFEVSPKSFKDIPGCSFAYWVSSEVRSLFKKLPPFGSSGRTVTQGLGTADDFRFVRAWWEVGERLLNSKWKPYAKGGAYSSYYSDIDLLVNWGSNGDELRNFADIKTGNIKSRVRGADKYFIPGFTYTSFTNLGFAPRVLPEGCIFSVVGMGIHGASLSELALLNSTPFKRLAAMTADHRAWQAGVIQRTPLPEITTDEQGRLEDLTRKSWLLKRERDTDSENSHAFKLPAALQSKLRDYDQNFVEDELTRIQTKVDAIAFAAYGFSDSDREVALGTLASFDDDGTDESDGSGDSENADGAEAIDQTDGLLSWAAGVAFGRFDWRLATGEREAPPEPEPFDPLPAKSPGMLPDDAEPFYAHSAILVDDQGHPNDFARLIEEVLARVEAPVPADVRRWLQRDFFPLHLKQYSKSRRKAPIYWPISTSSGSYTLWLYYPNLTSQTLYTAVNDFIEGPTAKLQQVEHDLVTLRIKGSARSAADEKNFEKLQALEAELIELRKTILEIAPNYRPNHDDGVQISAAPLWRLFRHKPWQKVLKDTWTKLEKGDYDWAHLAMAYWPERVREKCKTDKSLAITHDLEDLYEEPEVAQGATRGRTKTGDAT